MIFLFGILLIVWKINLTSDDIPNFEHEKEKILKKYGKNVDEPKILHKLTEKIGTYEMIYDANDCNIDMVYASVSSINAKDYALKGNDKYALIEIKEAIIGVKQALASCKKHVNSHKMDELTENLSRLYRIKKMIEKKNHIVNTETKQIVPKIINDNEIKGKQKIKISTEYYQLNGKTYFQGMSNLPENTKIGIRINNKASDFNIRIQKDGSFHSVGFSNRGKQIEGNTIIEILIYNNANWQSFDIMEKLNNYYGYDLKKGFGGSPASIVYEDYF
jgi:hypothetical protein